MAPRRQSLFSSIPWPGLGVFLGIGVMLLNVYLPYRNIQWVAEAARERERRASMIEAATELLSVLRDMQLGIRGYAITGNADFLDPYIAGLAEYPQSLQKLHALARDERDLELPRQLRPAVDELSAFHRRVVEARKRGDAAAAAQLIGSGEGKRVFERIRDMVRAGVPMQESDAQAAKEESGRHELALRASLPILAAIDLAVFGAVFYFAFRQLRQRTAAQSALAETGERLEESVRHLERANARVKLLGRMTDALQSCANAEEALALIAKFGAQLLAGYPGVVYFMQPSRDLLEPMAHWGAGGAQADPIEPDDCLALRRGQAYLLSDPAIEAVCPHVQRQQSGIGPRLCLPMSAHGEIIGLMSLDCAAVQGRLPEADRSLATSIGEQISMSLANLRLREQLRRQSIVDSLTGLYNRRFLDESLKRELVRAARKGQPLAVILLDADHFKRWNDTYGHEAGDHVLCLIGGALQQGVRGSDVACRYGGEEFALVLPEATLDAARLRAEAIRESIKALEVRYGGQILERITASFGVAAFPEHGRLAEELLLAADGALYRAKQAGRDRVSLAEPRATAAPAAPAAGE